MLTGLRRPATAGNPQWHPETDISGSNNSVSVPIDGDWTYIFWNCRRRNLSKLLIFLKGRDQKRKVRLTCWVSLWCPWAVGNPASPRAHPPSSFSSSWWPPPRSPRRWWCSASAVAFHGSSPPPRFLFEIQQQITNHKFKKRKEWKPNYRLMDVSACSFLFWFDCPFRFFFWQPTGGSFINVMENWFFGTEKKMFMASQYWMHFLFLDAVLCRQQTNSWKKKKNCRGWKPDLCAFTSQYKCWSITFSWGHRPRAVRFEYFWKLESTHALPLSRLLERMGIRYAKQLFLEREKKE